MWDISPAFYFKPLLTESNLWFAICIAAIMLGILIRDSSKRLCKRTSKVLERAQEKLWETEITGEQLNNKVMTKVIQLEAKEKWQTRPEGILLLMIIGGYTVNYLSSISGL